jgi:hypothetical protein
VSDVNSDPQEAERESLSDVFDKDVVLDTRGPLLYIGTLKAIGVCFYTLVDADVHDIADSSTSKEVYIMEAAKHGVRKNRESVLVRKTEIVSLSLLGDVVKY